VIKDAVDVIRCDIASGISIFENIQKKAIPQYLFTTANARIAIITKTIRDVRFISTEKRMENK
jgi:hypothetical protein